MKKILITWSIIDEIQFEWWKISVKSLLDNKKNRLSNVLILVGSYDIMKLVTNYLSNLSILNLKVICINDFYNVYDLKLNSLAKNNATIWSMYLPFIVDDRVILSLDNDIIFFNSPLLKKIDLIKFYISNYIVMGRKQNFNKDFGPYKYYQSRFPEKNDSKNLNKKIINGGLFLMKTKPYKKVINSFEILNESIEETSYYLSNTNEKWKCSEEIEIFKHFENRTYNKLPLRYNSTLWLDSNFVLKGIKNNNISIHFIGSTKSKLAFFYEKDFSIENKNIYKKEFISYYAELKNKNNISYVVEKTAELIFEHFWTNMIK